MRATWPIAAPTARGCRSWPSSRSAPIHGATNGRSRICSVRSSAAPSIRRLSRRRPTCSTAVATWNCSTIAWCRTVPGRSGLDFTAQRNSWGPNYLRFGVPLQDDFQGNTIFNAAGRIDFTELNSLGAELRLDGQLGTAPLLGDRALPAAVEYHALLRRAARPDRSARSAAGPERAAGGLLPHHSFDYGLDFGREFSNWGELRFGVLDEPRRIARQ